MLFAKYERTIHERIPQEKQRGTSERHLIFDLAQLPLLDAHQPLFHQQTIHLKQMEPQQVSWLVQCRPQIHLHPMPHGDPQLALPDLQEWLDFGQPQDHVTQNVATRCLPDEPALPH
jgi:hypothetical protein